MNSNNSNVKVERPTYLVIAENSSTRRNYNRTIRVYRVSSNTPTLIGMNNELHTAAYKGDIAEAATIISEVDGYELADAYRLKDETIKIFSLSTC